MTDEQFERLPKYVREKMERLKGERDAAVRKLNDYINSQTPSRIYSDSGECLGERPGPSELRQYIHAREITFLIGDDQEVNIRFDDHRDPDALVISTDSELVFKPSASNSIRIERSIE